MNEIFHIIGICPDNLAHQDFIDIFILNYQEFINQLKTIKLYLWN